MAFVENFLIPLIEVCFILGLVGFPLCWLGYRIWKAWKVTLKWYWKYKIKKNEYDEELVAWIMECIDKDFSYYDVKRRLLLLKRFHEEKVNEVMWIFEQIMIQVKGGKSRNGKLTRSDRKNEAEAKLPNFTDTI